MIHSCVALEKSVKERVKCGRVCLETAEAFRGNKHGGDGVPGNGGVLGKWAEYADILGEPPDSKLGT